MKAQDQKAQLAILGNDARPLLNSGDKVADREGAERLVRAYAEANKLEKSDDKVVLVVKLPLGLKT